MDPLSVSRGRKALNSSCGGWEGGGGDSRRKGLLPSSPACVASLEHLVGQHGRRDAGVDGLIQTESY